MNVSQKAFEQVYTQVLFSACDRARDRTLGWANRPEFPSELPKRLAQTINQVHTRPMRLLVRGQILDQLGLVDA